MRLIWDRYRRLFDLNFHGISKCEFKWLGMLIEGVLNFV